MSTSKLGVRPNKSEDAPLRIIGCGKTHPFGGYGLKRLRENDRSLSSPVEPALSLSNGDG